MITYPTTVLVTHCSRGELWGCCSTEKPGGNYTWESPGASHTWASLSVPLRAPPHPDRWERQRRLSNRGKMKGRRRTHSQMVTGEAVKWSKQAEQRKGQTDVGKKRRQTADVTHRKKLLFIIISTRWRCTTQNSSPLTDALNPNRFFFRPNVISKLADLCQRGWETRFFYGKISIINVFKATWN